MPKIVDHQLRREEILEKCFNLFAKHGYSALTMREIAQNLKVSTGTLYHYFDSKKTLFEAMFRWIAHRDAMIAKDFISKEKGDLKMKITLLEQFLLNHSQNLTNALVIASDFLRTQESRDSLFLTEIIESYVTLIQTEIGIEDQIQAKAVFSFIIGNLLYGSLDSSFNIKTGISFLSLIHLIPSFIENLPNMMHLLDSNTKV
jgi:AcrR family transcriptional regulator